MEKVLTDSSYLIRKTGTNYTQIVHRIRIRPITPQYQVEDVPEIDPANFRTDPSLGHHPSLLQDDTPVESVQPTTFDSPVRVSISFGQSNQAQQHLPPPLPPAINPNTANENHTIVESDHTRIRLTPPVNLTADIPEASDSSDENPETIQPVRRSDRIATQPQPNFKLIEAAGRQLKTSNPIKRTSQGETKEARNFIDLLKNRRLERQQKQFVQRPGSQQEGANEKRSRPDINEICQTRYNVNIVYDNICSSSSMAHCVSSDFAMGVGIADQFDRLYPRIKTQSSKNLAPGSVFAYYDKYSRRWIYNLVTKRKFFNKPSIASLRSSLLLMRDHAQR